MNNIYEEIFEKEKYLTELTNHKLLNTYYLTGSDGLKEFYIDKLNKLENEYEKNNIIKEIIIVIKEIIEKIDEFINSYNNGNEVDVNSIYKYFLYNKMNSKLNKENILLKEQVLRNVRKNTINEEDYDYLTEPK